MPIMTDDDIAPESLTKVIGCKCKVRVTISMYIDTLDLKETDILF